MAVFSGSCTPYPCSALAGRHDGDVICLTQPTVNNPTPQCSPNGLFGEGRALSQKRSLLRQKYFLFVFK